MSIGNIVVEIELRDGQYHSGMTRARNDSDLLASGISSLNNRMQDLQSGLTGTLPRLRDMSIVAMTLHSAYSTLNNTVGELSRSLIASNASIEKTQVLLQGMSKSVDMGDKIKDAKRDLAFLFDTAKKAPFSLGEITNSFVKMRAVGIGDVEAKVKSLANAIANFGGDDQTLHKATIAIQQMVSKGILSMEELRQQLGEALPNAMNMMADGMGMTMQSLNKKISEGKIKSVNAVEGMMYEMELSMAGSSLRMMKTWSGMTSQLSTNWALLQKQMGDAGFFDAAKEQLSRLNGVLQSDDALKYGQMVGDTLKKSVDGVEELTHSWSENKDIIGKATKALLEFWLLSKVITSAGAMGIAGASIASSIVAQGRGLQSGLAAARNPTVSRIIPINWGTPPPAIVGPPTPAQATLARYGVNTGAQMGQISNSMGQVAANTTAWSRSLATAGFALRALTGPLGSIALATGIIASQFVDFSTEADKAAEGLQGVIDKQAELNKLTERRGGDAALKTYQDITEAEKNLKTLIEDNKSKQASLDRYTGKTDNSENPIGGFFSAIPAGLLSLGDNISGKSGIEGAILNQKAMILSLISDIVTVKEVASGIFDALNFEKKLSDGVNVFAKKRELAEKAVAESRIELFDRVLEREKALEAEKLETTKASLTTEYNIKKAAINKAIDAEIIANESRKGDAVKSSKEENEIKRLAFLELHKQINGDQIKLLEEQKAAAISAFEALQERVKPIKLIVDAQASTETLKTQQNSLIFSIAEIKAQIQSTTNEAKKLNLTKALSVNTSLLDRVAKEIAGLGDKIKTLKADGAITETDIVNFGSAQSKIQVLEESLSKLQKLKKDFGLGISPGDGAEITGEGEKAIEAKKKKLGTEYDRSVDGLKEAAIQIAETFDPTTFSDAIAKGADSITAALNVLNKAIAEGKDFASNGRDRVLAESASILRQTTLDQQGNRPYGELIDAASKKYNLPDHLLEAVMSIESGGNKNAKSSAGAVGLTQLMPDTAKRFGVTDRTDPKQSLEGGAKYLAFLFDKFNQDLKITLAAYNAGEGAVVGAVKNAKGHYVATHAPMVPNYPETQAYVKNGLDKIAGLSSGTVSGKDIVEQKSRQDVNKEIANNAALSTALKAQTDAQKDLLKVKQDLVVSDTEAAKQRALKDQKPLSVSDSAETIAIKAQIEEYKKRNLNIDLLNNQLKDSLSKDANDSLIEGYKKTQSEFARIKNDADEDFKRSEAFKLDLQRSTAQALIASQQALVKDGKALYEQDVANYVENLRDKAKDRGVAMNKETEDLIENQRKMFEITRQNIAKTEAAINKANLTFSLRVSSNERATIPQIDKERNRLAIEKEQDLYNNSLTKQDPILAKANADNINEKYKSDLEDIKYANRNAFEQMMGDATTFYDVAGEAEATFTNGVIDGTTQLLTQGSLNFKQFAASVMKDISAMLIKYALLKIAQMAVQAIGAYAGGGGKSIANYGTRISPQKDGGVLDLSKFADGGVHGAKLASSLEMSRGGVKNKPHVALFAEAGMPEAFIPMRDGKTIPISVTQGANGELSAKALLPNGRSIPTTIKDTNITKYADGGIHNGLVANGAQIAVSGANATIANNVLFGGLISSLDALTRSLSSIKPSDFIPLSVTDSHPSVADKSETGKTGAQINQRSGDNVSIQIFTGGAGGGAGGGVGKKDEKDRGDSKMWENLGGNIKALVIKTINEEKRPNGALWNNS